MFIYINRNERQIQRISSDAHHKHGAVGAAAAAVAMVFI